MRFEIAAVWQLFQISFFTIARSGLAGQTHLNSIVTVISLRRREDISIKRYLVFIP
jgi:hypothetical protein